VKRLAGKYLILSALECTNETDYDNAISLLTGSNIVDNPEISEYYHIRNQPVLDFTLTNLLIKEVPKNQDVLDELLLFNTEEKAQKEIRKIFKKIEDKDFNLLKAFCFLYSTNLIYHPFNLACATRSYSKIIKTLRFLLQDLKKQDTRIFKENVVLYRGMPKDSIKLQQYQDASGFWPCFSSTSRKETVAKQFASKAGVGGFVFIITLSQKNMHPGVIIGSEWSQFPLEDEILLFPYLSLTTTLIEKKKDLTYIHVKQNDKDTVLSLEETSIWIERVKKNLKESIELEFDKISRDLDNALDITEAGEQFEALLIKKLNISVQDYIHEKKVEFFSNNNEEEEAYTTPKQGLFDDLQTRILPQIINEALDEAVLGLYEQTNKRIHKIVSEELIRSPQIRNNIDQKVKYNSEKILELWRVILNIFGVSIIGVLMERLFKQSGQAQGVLGFTFQILQNMNLNSDQPRAFATPQNLAPWLQESSFRARKSIKGIIEEYKISLEEVKRRIIAEIDSQLSHK